MTGPVSGVVLAAGLSTRFETGANKPKQLYRVDGESLVRRTCRAALTSGLGEVVVVTGYAAERVQSEVKDLDLRAVHNPSYADGQSGSVRCGLASVADDAEGAMFLPVDQPGLNAAVIDRLLGAFDGPGSIVVPTYRGRRGAPATFGRDWFARLEDLRGDEGARPLLRELAPRVYEVELDSELPLVDIDTEAEARAWVEGSGTP
ncbi:MAG: nucleotidyltransferase family protein [Holophagales bacterium]|nr:nucleotidyltransferase family protein [Holophagales bacterium]MYD22567.1 nucleotidyltransferase family protein [Holophagales bacterium]MYI33817.1 nucleotidyltransferase family protein [Holophagales bacterium]